MTAGSSSAPKLPAPDHIPGQLVSDKYLLRNLKQHVMEICGLQNMSFPGSQPISFTYQSLAQLESQDFWVCEKSDGIRALLLIVNGTGNPPQEVYFIDRKNEYYRVTGILFPSAHQKDRNQVRLQKDTLLDGEIVIDVDKETKKQTWRYLAFDCVVCEGRNLRESPLDSRYGNLHEFVIKPFNDHLKNYPNLVSKLPFEMQAKKMERAYGIQAVFKDHVPMLEHGSDGLIFSCTTTPYVTGTDKNILKWKPPSENSIDFRLELRFKPLPNNPSRPDYGSKPLFVLMENVGNNLQDEPFDLLEVSDEQWNHWKSTNEQLDNRIVEVVWDIQLQTWKMIRFRDDKFEGNFTAVVQKIIRSIQDGVEPDELIDRAAAMRAGWVHRDRMRKEANLPAYQPLDSEELDPIAHTKLNIII